MIIFGILGIVVLLLALMPVTMHGVAHAGVYMMLAIGLILCGIGFFHERIRHLCGSKFHLVKIVSAVIGSLFLVFVVVVTSMMLYAAYGKAPSRDEQCTVVVLGCQVKGTEENYYPSLMLSRRLEAAAAYLKENPEAACVVSGGKGKNEPVPESRAMKDYLVEQGIEPSRIMEEYSSVNTAENITFSKEVMEKNRLPGEMVIVTDGFHQLRAQTYAKNEGMEAKGISADTPMGLNVSYYVREWFALIRLAVLGV
ncbi:YdcF family protein [Candidatus Soleaferrea massiliensis]|uniref:YdcF family protein n=1 Tax=Candidatus Soleaferrea massiliensis TaxID=1470354 RepID=UPI00069485A8|nr:YdcF family protein [Candidatus Soleaferrea massiliensis]